MFLQLISDADPTYILPTWPNPSSPTRGQSVIGVSIAMAQVDESDLFLGDPKRQALIKALTDEDQVSWNGMTILSVKLPSE